MYVTTVMQGKVVEFNPHGTRHTTTLDAYQYHFGEEGIGFSCWSTITTSPSKVMGTHISCVLCVHTE